MNKINTTEIEAELFKELLEYNKNLGGHITFRVAGGWVRDKLMGVPCEDIDIAIDKTSGILFAKGFIKYLRAKKKDVGGFHVIPYNHEKSKHLETASLRYYNYAVDFVALRSETYADTRIPMVRVGTPKEDAYRRDLTINALFYNINTQEIEDYTERGVGDIQSQVIRTPLPPRETFLDDPLRILRALRFASRLGFSVSAEIFQSLKEKLLIERMSQIVSRERIGTEMYKMLQAPKYFIGVQHMVEAEIIPAIFTKPVRINTEQTSRYLAAHAALEKKREQIFSMPEDSGTVHPYCWVGGEEVYLVRLFSILQHTLGCPKEQKMSLGAWIVHNDLKFPKKVREKVERIVCTLEIAETLHIATPDDERKHFLIKLARSAETLLPVVLSIWDIVQKARNTPEHHQVNVCAVYTDLHAHGYDRAWEKKHPVDYSIVLRKVEAHMSVPPEDKKKYIDTLIDLSILYKTTEVEKLLPHLRACRLLPQTNR